jgi:hypothetical protein
VITAPWVCIKILLLFIKRGILQPTDAYGIKVKVSGCLQEIAVFIDEKGFITSLIEMTGTVVRLVKPARVGYIEMTHEILEVRLGCPYDDMEMVGHEDKSEEMNLIRLKGTFKDLQKLLLVVIVKKDSLSSVSPACHMV